jgi:hypothetical protein
MSAVPPPVDAVNPTHALLPPIVETRFTPLYVCENVPPPLVSRIVS